MAVNNIPIRVVWRRNNNAESTAYGKYYLEALNSKTLSTLLGIDYKFNNSKK